MPSDDDAKHLKNRVFIVKIFYMKMNKLPNFKLADIITMVIT